MEQYPWISKYLARDAEIRHSKHFENGVAKIAEENESGFTVEESGGEEPLRVSNRLYRSD